MKKVFVITLAFLLSTHSAKLLSQNTGPVAPEATSFEPVDATDMVNLVSGDLSYVLPLVNVPSPEGGFSMALSYHAGITMDQEASWVGLGWNITPGAINRGINGYADDSKEAKVIGYTNIDATYYTQFTRGIYLPLEVFGLPSIGLQYSFGSHRSFGGSIGYAGASISLNSDGDFSAGYSAGIGGKESPFSVGGSIGTQGIGINVGISTLISNNFAASASVGFNFDPSSGSYSVEGGGGLSAGSIRKGKFKTIGSVASVGFSLGSGGFSMQYRGVGVSSLMFGKLSEGDMSCQVLENSSYNFIIVNCSNFKVKFWAFKAETDTTYGTLYIDEAHKRGEWNRQTYGHKQDVYTIPLDYGYMANTDAYDCSENLMFPAYDNFLVSVQGLSGSIAPHLLKNGLLTGDGRVVVAGGDGKELYYQESTGWGGSSDTYNTQAKYFYFDNEPVSYASISDGIFSYPDALTDPFWGPVTFTGGELNTKNNKFFNSTLVRKGSTKPVEWFTNKDIVNDEVLKKGKKPLILPSRGFIETSDIVDRSDKTLFPEDGIGAFTITDVDGKKYYFSLPVYQFEEFTRSYPNPSAGDYVERRNFGTYAYTWLLTAITGPDYVDLTGDGPSPDDYGYCVKFNYGNWTDGYIWQLPYTDLGHEKPYHWGRKQVYYLNSIQTRTHTAYFVKNLRDDALGADLYSDFAGSHTNVSMKEEWKNCWSGLSGTGGYMYDKRTFNDNFIAPKYHSSLLLDRIVIIKNSDAIQAIEQKGAGIKGLIYDGVTYGHFSSEMDHWKDNGYDSDCDKKPITSDPTQVFLDNRPFRFYYSNKTLDITDIPADFEKEHAIRVFKFNYDYSLCQGTPNSKAYTGNGKLTLKNVTVYGKNMTQTMPSYVFNYNMKGENKFDYDNKDLWGYDKNNTDNWSLREILTPVGSKFAINYESDKYEKEAIYNGIAKKQTVTNPQISLINDFTAFTNYSIYPSPANSSIIGPLSNWFKVSGSATGLKSGKDYYINANINAHLHSYYYKALVGSDWYDHNSSLNCASLRIYNMVINGDNFSGDVYINNYWEAAYIMFANENREFKDKAEAQMGWLSVLTTGKYEQTTLGAVTTLIEPYPVIEDANLVYVDAPELTNGGGLRVSAIAVTDPATNQTQTTQYTYSNGVTTYAPKDFEFYVPYQSEIPPPMVYYGNVSVKTIGANGALTGRTDYVFETPAVCSGDFRNSEFAMGDVASDKYQFKVENLQYTKDKTLTTGANSTKLTTRSAKITNNFVKLGSLIQMSTYNSAGNLLGKTVNNYKTPSQIDQGVVQETFQSMKAYADWMNDYVYYPATYFMVSSSKVSYPAMLASTVSTANNNSTTVTFDKYDFITGNVLEQTTTGNGKTAKSISIPAYQVYENMGPSYDDPDKKNMLAQPAAAYNYLDGSLINASVQTWNNDWSYREYNTSADKYTDQNKTDVPTYQKIWRKERSFVWKGEVNPDGTYKNFPALSGPSQIITNWATFFSGNGTNGWIKTNQITRYDHYSAPLEASDINGKFAATKMGDYNSKVIASASNANYNSFAYSGFEYPESKGTLIDYGGEFMGHELTNTLTRSNPSGIVAHTGEYYCAVSSQQGPAFEMEVGGTNGLLAGRKYKASVWIYKTGSANAVLKIELRNSSETPIDGYVRSKGASTNKQFGDWMLVEDTLTVPATAAGNKLATYVYNDSTSLPVYIDDIRVQPVDAAVTAFAYDEVGQVTAILNNDNFASKFQYDDAGRLIATYKETPAGFKKVSENKYNYARKNDYVASFFTTPLEPYENTSTMFSAFYNGEGAKYQWVYGGKVDPAIPTTNNVYRSNGLDRAVTSITLNAYDADGILTTISKPVKVLYIDITSISEGQSISKANDKSVPVAIAGNFSYTASGLSYEVYIPGDNVYVPITLTTTFFTSGWTIPETVTIDDGYGHPLYIPITSKNGYKIRGSYGPYYKFESPAFEIIN